MARTTREVSREAYRLFEDNSVALLKPEENKPARQEGSRLVGTPLRVVRCVDECVAHGVSVLAGWGAADAVPCKALDLPF